MTPSDIEILKICQATILQQTDRIEELEQKLKEKETYHADCLRIKQLENQVEGYKGENGEQFERIEQLEQQLARLQKFFKWAYYNEPTWISEKFPDLVKEFESEQND